MEKRTAFTQIPNEILDRLCRTDLTAREMRVALFIIRNTCGYHHDKWQMSNSFIAKALGLDRTNARRILCSLEKKGLIIQKRDGTLTKSICLNLSGGVTHDPSSGVTRNPSNGVTRNPSNGVTHDPSSGVTRNPSNGVTHDPRSGVTRNPGSGVTHDPQINKEENKEINKEENKEKNNNNSSVVDHSNGVDWAAWRRELGME